MVKSRKWQGLFQGLLLGLCIMCGAGPALSGEFCGSKEGQLNELVGTFLIPDQFPPESELLAEVITAQSEMADCAGNYGVADLGRSCEEHDRCYETSGAGKGSCDKKLRDGWVKSCRAQYKDRGDFMERIKLTGCRLSCEVFVKLMSEAQTSNNNGFCPSCDAFEVAQQRAHP